LTKIEPCFRHLLKLRKLALQENQISKIENIGKCTNLQQLWLFSNKITQIENLDTNIMLKDLNLADNQIKKITNISRLVNLASLDLSGNPIINLPFIDEISELPSLEALFFASPHFEQCPIALLPNYRTYILTTINSSAFMILDDEKITPEELHNSRNEYVQLMNKMASNIEEIENSHLTTLLQLDSKSKEDEDALDLLREKCIEQLEEVKETIDKGRQKITKEHEHLQEIRNESEEKLKNDLAEISKEYQKKITELIKNEEEILTENNEKWDNIVDQASYEKNTFEILVELMFSSQGKILYAEISKDSPEYLFLQNQFGTVPKSNKINIFNACLIYNTIEGESEMSSPIKNTEINPSKQLFSYARIQIDELSNVLLGKSKPKEFDKNLEECTKKIIENTLILLYKKDLTNSPAKLSCKNIYAVIMAAPIKRDSDEDLNNNKENLKNIANDEKLAILVNSTSVFLCLSI